MVSEGQDVSLPERLAPPPPSMMDQCQGKGLTKFAFRKHMILNTMLPVGRTRHPPKMRSKKKSGSKLPHSKQDFT